MKYKIDSSGFYLGSYSLEYYNNYVPKEEQIYYIDNPVNNNFIKPKYNGTEWVESATNQDVENNDFTLSNNYLEEIKTLYTTLSIRALQSSMEKTGTYEYLQVQRTEYENKYKVCKGDLIDPYLEDAIVKEMDRDYTDQSLSDLLISLGVTPTGTKRQQFSQLVIFKYEYSLDRLNRFMGFLVDFRTKSITMVENKEWDKLDQCFDLAKSIPEQLDMTDAENIYNQFNTI